MDTIDRKIVVLLQDDASLSLAEIAHRVGLSQSPCWKRIQRLEKAGIILKRVALVSPESIGVGLSVFVSIESSTAWRATSTTCCGWRSPACRPTTPSISG
jgi:Lrp/AsnC family transcriptional regulator